MTFPLSRDLQRYGIRVVTIAPGFIRTPMTNQFDKFEDVFRKHITMGRFGEAQEVSNAVKFVIENDYFNGKILELDGGYLPNL